MESRQKLVNNFLDTGDLRTKWARGISGGKLRTAIIGSRMLSIGTALRSMNLLSEGLVIGIPESFISGKTSNERKPVIAYASHGSHLAETIAWHLKQGWHLFYRAQTKSSKDEAVRVQNNLLAKFYYDWNIHSIVNKSVIAPNQALQRTLVHRTAELKR